ncbi:hypothetical protein QZH41_004717 [Actinostola sp. cb2023]|nr:hypothetical protein QZH41_004717 [Actinostola sp. cb2023]
MVPIDLLSQDFSLAMDTEIVVNRLRNMLKDCNIDEITSSGVTALTQSALDGRLESVKLLIELGANVNRKDRFGWTALHYAPVTFPRCYGNSTRIRTLQVDSTDVTCTTCPGMHVSSGLGTVFGSLVKGLK